MKFTAGCKKFTRVNKNKTKQTVVSQNSEQDTSIYFQQFKIPPIQSESVMSLLSSRLPAVYSFQQSLDLRARFLSSWKQDNIQSQTTAEGIYEKKYLT